MRSGLGNFREVFLFSEWVIEIADGGDGVKKAEKVYSGFGSAKGSLEAFHVFLSLIFILKSASPHHMFLIGPIRKRYHLLIPLRQQANAGDHPGQESSGKSTSRETKYEDFVVLIVIAHDETVAGHDMLIEACAESQIQGLSPPTLESSPETCIYRLVTSDIGSYPGYIGFSC